ncbi:MAG: hypothetical protein KAT91_03945 [Candidatus Aenigmarchaeota archaeon]|nr:hypothetical protein [Candidatus Aenigmarchaeota archaeon]
MIFICGGPGDFGVFAIAAQELSFLTEDTPIEKINTNTQKPPYLGENTVYRQGVVLIQEIDGSVEEKTPTGYQINQLGSSPYWF